ADHWSGAEAMCLDVYNGFETTCRSALNQCVAGELCCGPSGSCTALDGFALMTKSCTGTSNGGVCDGADHCSGTAATCLDVYKGKVGRGRCAVRECDVVEVCSGTSGSCMVFDGFGLMMKC